MKYFRNAFRTLYIVLGVAGLVFGFTMTSAPSAEASVSCYGDYCSGQDPHVSGCDADAITVASAPVTYFGGSVSSGVVSVNIVGGALGEVELRWSPTCKTNWARVNMWADSIVDGVQTIQDTGYNQISWVSGYTPYTQAGVMYSPMIYSPDNRVRARVLGASGSTKWM